jgi:ribosomal protein L7/L12
MGDENQHVTAAFADKLLDLLQQGRKIEAIKLFREFTGVGLSEAKDAVETFSLAHGMSRHGGDQVIAPDDFGVAVISPQRQVQIPPALSAELMRLCGQGQKIEAIKLMREKTGLGLKEAKDAVEALERGESPTVGVSDFGPDPAAAVPPEQLQHEVLALLGEGELIAAVKRWREVTGSDLKTAKDAIDRLAAGPQSAAAKALTPAPPVPENQGQPGPDDQNFEDDIVAILKSGRNKKKEAIHRYMAMTGESNERARQAVENIALRNGLAKKGACFVATVCYGSYEAPEVVVLRRFRDERLLPSRVGAVAVSLYYIISPPLARVIAGRPRLRKLIKYYFIGPMVAWIKKPAD